MSQIVQCPECSTKCRVPEGAAKARCPKCSNILVVESNPSPRVAPAKPSVPTGAAGTPKTSKSIKCPKCQTLLALRPDSAGKSVRCPSCTTVLRIPGGETTNTPSKVSSPVSNPLTGSPRPATRPATRPVASRAAKPAAEYDPFGSAGSGGGAFDDDFSAFSTQAPKSSPTYSPYQAPAAIALPKQPAATKDWESWLTDTTKWFKLVGIVSAVCFLLSAIPFVGVFAFFAILVAYAIVQFVGGIWLLSIAFKEDIVQGLVYLFVPFYALYYLISRWANCKPAFMLCMVGVAGFLASLFGTVVGAILYGLLFAAR
jgi:DNA-directed RNA polymerase subunit RPC12/RpoP